jgi:hypothetical protein
LATVPFSFSVASQFDLDCFKQSICIWLSAKNSCLLKAVRDIPARVKIARSFLEVLFPKVRAELLRLLLTAPPKARYVRELARMSGLALCTVQAELCKPQRCSACQQLVPSNPPFLSRESRSPALFRTYPYCGKEQTTSSDAPFGVTATTTFRPKAPKGAPLSIDRPGKMEFFRRREAMTA